jgi:hypothetical protein
MHHTTSSNENIILDESDELSIHSSDDELDQYIIPRPPNHSFPQTNFPVKDSQQNDNNESDPLDDPEEFYRQIIQKGYLALGIDFVGTETRKYMRCLYKPEPVLFLGKRYSPDLKSSTDMKTDDFSVKKKIKLFDSGNQNLNGNACETRQVEVYGQSWIEDIYDSLSEINRRLFKRLQKEYMLANSHYKTCFSEIFRMLLNRFKNSYYNVNLDFRENLIHLMNFICHFFKGKELNKNFFDELPTPLNNAIQVE